MPFQKTGPITQDELFQLWLSVVDKQGYAVPLVNNPNSGIELIEQVHAQMARVSLAVDRSFQSLYILPSSAQTNPPAGGAKRAGVDLVITRSGQGTVPAHIPIIFQPGVAYDHFPTDSSIDGPVKVFSGRRYMGSSVVVLGPGTLGPVTVHALSERPFAGYNLPQPNTITVIDQPGTGLSNIDASVSTTPSTSRLLLAPDPDVLGPQHIGQYVIFTAGANVRRVRRVIGYENPGPTDGGTAVLASTGVLRISGTVGNFIVGEQIIQATSNAHATFLYSDGTNLILEMISGVLDGTHGLTGVQSGATTSVLSIDEPPLLTPEAGTAAWQVLDWAKDLGVQVTNPASPSGAQTPMLDALGRERDINRSPNEPDDVYRQRVAVPADVVSPNALLRAINRIAVPNGLNTCFREVGTEKLRGLFFDGDPTSNNPDIAFAYDLDFTLRPADRYKLTLDYTEFRAFFLVGVPSLGLGEFGCAYDSYPTGAFDAAPYLAFYDGFPLGDSVIYLSFYNALNKAKAGGVGFDLVRDDLGCS